MPPLIPLPEEVIEALAKAKRFVDWVESVLPPEVRAAQP